jgi:hypothetical protein
VPTRAGAQQYTAQLLDLIAQVATLEQRVADLGAQVKQAAEQYTAGVRAVADCGAGVRDGQPLNWDVLERAVLGQTDAGFDVLRTVGELGLAYQELLGAVGRALLHAATRDAPVV